MSNLTAFEVSVSWIMWYSWISHVTINRLSSMAHSVLPMSCYYINTLVFLSHPNIPIIYEEHWLCSLVWGWVGYDDFLDYHGSCLKGHTNFKLDHTLLQQRLDHLKYVVTKYVRTRAHIYGWQDTDNLIQRIDDMYLRLDNDGSGGLTFSEFKSGITNLPDTARIHITGTFLSLWSAEVVVLHLYKCRNGRRWSKVVLMEGDEAK